VGPDHAHDTVETRDGAASKQAVRREDGHDAAATAAARTPGSLARFSAATLSSLQRSAGSRAISHALAGEGLAVQRHAEGEELPAKEAEAAEVTAKASATSSAAPPAGAAPTAGVAGAEEASGAAAPTPTSSEAPPQQETSNAAPPAATRTAAEETTQKGDATKAGGEYEKARKLSPGAQSLAGAQKVLQGAYGGLKTIVTGTIEILADQPACSAKYDEVCMRDGVTRPDGSAWKAGDCAKDDAAAGVQTEGFAWKGVVYVNGKTTLVTATTHEMLHLNTEATFRATVGETINEGSTEYFARKAMSASGVTVPAASPAYPDQIKIVTDLISLVGEDTLLKAYFEDPQELVKAYEAKGSKTFAELKVAAEALNTAAVADALKPKPAAATPAPAGSGTVGGAASGASGTVAAGS
jgi:hypothetical protein